MTNHPEAALRALEQEMSYAIAIVEHVKGADLAIQYVCNWHEKISAILRQIEAAPSLPDSSQGEAVAWNIEVVPVVVRDVSDAHYVRLSIGCQHFNIGPDYLDTRADAEWFKAQLDTALRRVAAPQSAPKAAEPVDAGCICKGNWRAIVADVEHLIDETFLDADGNEYIFFGVVLSLDDYYYGMSRKSDKGRKLALLSCVGSIEGHGYTLAIPQRARSLAQAEQAAKDQPC